MLVQEAQKAPTFMSQVLGYGKANTTVGPRHDHHLPLDPVLAAALHWLI